MSDPVVPAAESAVREYLPRENVGMKAAMYLAGGLVWLLMLALYFVMLLVSTRPAGPHVPGMIGGMCVPGIFAIAYALFLLRSPKRLRLDADGLTIDGFTSSKRIAWNQVAQLRREKSTALMQQKAVDVLVLVNDKQKELGRIVDVFQDFAGLVSAIETASAAARGQNTYDRNAELQRKLSQQRKKRLRLTLLCIPLFCAGVAGAIWGAHDWIKERQLATDGIVTDAAITKRSMVRVTPRLEYSITDPSGRVYTNEVMMEQRAWDALALARTVPVRYLPSDPAWSHLVLGEDTMHSPGLLVLAGCVLALIFGGFLVMQLFGISDIATENGRLVFKRIGDVDDSLEKSAPVVSPLPLQYVRAQPVAPDQPGRLPTAIKVIATLNLILGFMGILINGAGALVQLRGVSLDLPQGTIDIPRDVPLGLWSLGDLTLALLLMVAGVGLFLRRGWARWLSITVAVPQIISTLGVLAVQIHSVTTGGFATSADSQAAMVGAVIGIALRALGIVFPIILLIVLTRPFAKAALAPRT